MNIGTPSDTVAAERGKATELQVLGQDEMGQIVEWTYPDTTYLMGRRLLNGIEAYRVIKVTDRKSNLEVFQCQSAALSVQFQVDTVIKHSELAKRNGWTALQLFQREADSSLKNFYGISNSLCGGSARDAYQKWVIPFVALATLDSDEKFVAANEAKRKSMRIEWTSRLNEAQEKLDAELKTLATKSM